ncbi:MAG: SCO6880 family protein [Angustibacter sp.]
MAAAETASTGRSPTYGNWRRPRSPGLGNLGMLGTGLLLAGLIAVILTMMLAGFIAAIVLTLVLGVFLGLMLLRDRHHRSGVQRVTTRVGWSRARRAGSHLYRSGPLGLTPWGSCQLPGLAAASRLSQGVDSYGRAFSVLHVPATGHFTVAFVSEPDGDSLVDPEQVDSWVAHWGHWLATLGNEPGVVAAAATIETAPDSGSRLRREVGQRLDDSAPAVAQAMLREVTETYPQGSATVKAWVTITFSGSARAGGRRRNADEVARDLASRLPGLGEGLHATGAGAARPMTAQERCEIVRTAYDPPAARLIDDAHAAGQVPDLRWSDVGPTAAQAAWDSYRHDGAVSVSWSMSQAPRGEVPSSVLRRLLAPHPDIDRKRVTLLFRPVDAGLSAQIVEADKRSAEFRVNSTVRPTARALTDRAAAEATAREEARGAGLVNFGMVLTATVDGGPDGRVSGERVADARAAIDTLAGTARLLLRPVWGSQDSAFLAGLPLGLVLPRHLKVPAEIRDAL